tara:strand:+ start:160 stop:546 length:387 start_codon:yes stop_codon:yes gene_type:complete
MRDMEQTEELSALPEAIRASVLAAQDKKAMDVVVLDLRSGTAFTDFFVICSGQHPRQVKAIAESIEERLRRHGARPTVVEGAGRAEWILLDFFDFVVHVFTPEVRDFYELERLWGEAERLDVSSAEPA